MAEKIIGIIKNTQGKSKTSATIKTCDIIVTSDRVLVVPMGGSTLVSGMIGQAVAGTGGAIGYATGTQLMVDDKRSKLSGNTIDEILGKEPEAIEIKVSEINKSKSSFKTGFLSTLGMWAPLTIKTIDGKRYFYNVPNGDKAVAKEILKYNDMMIVK